MDIKQALYRGREAGPKAGRSWRERVNNKRKRSLYTSYLVYPTYGVAVLYSVMQLDLTDKNEIAKLWPGLVIANVPEEMLNSNEDMRSQGYR